MGWLSWSLILLLVAIIAGMFGYSGVASLSAGVSKVLFFLFLTVSVILLIVGVVMRGAVST